MPTTILKKKYDFKFDASILDFEAEPGPPSNYRCGLQWNHHGWDKGFGNMVLTRDVRESWEDCLGGFPHFAAPELLDEADFRKFCYLAEKDESHCLDKIPRNYLPLDFRNKPDEWEERQFRIRENAKRFKSTGLNKHLSELLGDVADDSSDDEGSAEENKTPPLFIDENGEYVSRNEEVRLEGLENEEFNGRLGTLLYKDPRFEDRFAVTVAELRGDKPISIKASNLRKAVSTRKQKASPKVDWDKIPSCKKPLSSTASLLDLDSNTRMLVASFLNVPSFDELRLTCKDARRNWVKPPPEIEYDFVYFSVTDDYSYIKHGVAHTLNDVMRAVSGYKEGWRKYTNDQFLELTMTFQFVKFDRKHAVVPLMKFDANQYYEDPVAADLEEIGEFCFGVESPFPNEEIGSSWQQRFTIYLPDVEMMDEEKLPAILKWCDGLQPREPRVDLLDIGSRIRDCGYCGMDDERCRCRTFPPLAPSSSFYCEEKLGPGGSEGDEHRIYYSPRWFGRDKNRVEYTGPSNQDTKNYVIFADETDLYSKD